MGHKPSEAAYINRVSLIDGLPYQVVDANDTKIQEAYIGETFMTLRIDEAAGGNWRLQLDPGKLRVLVWI